MPVRPRRVFQMLVLPAVPALLLIVNQMLASQFADARKLAEELEQAHLTREQLRTILSIHQDIETGQRGYLLTDNPAFLEPYSVAQRRLDGEFSKLAALGVSQPEFRSAFAEVRALSSQKRGFAAQVVSLAQSGRKDQAVQLVGTQRGKSIMDAMRARIGVTDAAIERDLVTTREDRASARVQTERVAYALQALLVVMLLIAAWLLLRSLRAERQIARRFRDSSARQEAVFDAATDGLIIHDSKGVIDSVNPAMAGMFGYTPAELPGRHIDIFFNQPFPRDQLEAWLRRIAGTPAGSQDRTREFIGCRKDGNIFPADVVTSPVALADRTVFLAAVRDASERKRVEHMKNDFVATVSHELRTPLTSIAGSLGLLGGGAVGALPEKAVRLIRIAHSNTERLVRLVNDMLDIEKIESGKMALHLKRIRLDALLDQAVQANRGFATRHQVELHLAVVPGDAAVIADEDRLIQVVTNLLSNAVKFSPADGTVNITVTREGGCHRITVSDDGPGIPDGFRDRIFEKFAQADASDARSKSGTGLGLPIAREIVTRLGGALSFDSVPGGGAAFHIDLPVADAEAAPLRPHGSSGLPCILHVDDDPDILRVVAEAFDGKANISSILSVREADAALRRDQFDAAILDVALADGSGLDLLGLLRDADRPTPTILLTIHDVSPAYEARVDGVFNKSNPKLDRLVDAVMALAQRGGKQ